MSITNTRAGQAVCVRAVKDAPLIELSSLPARPAMDAILMCDPSHFEVKDVKNAFMDGNVAAVDPAMAKRQWQELAATFKRLGHPVAVQPSAPGLEDMVFTANQMFVGFSPKLGAYAVPGRMRYPSRRREVQHFRAWFQERGYRILELPVTDGESLFFEAHGDAIWHPGRQLIWGGYGQRTAQRAYELLSGLLAVPVVTLSLPTEKFYHLDTAFSPLDEESVLIYPGAFDADGLALIRHYFKNVVAMTEADADNFAGNALALGKKVVLQRGSTDTCRQLSELGFEPVEVDTGEFMKSGGSVFCLKLAYYKSAPAA